MNYIPNTRMRMLTTCKRLSSFIVNVGFKDSTSTVTIPTAAGRLDKQSLSCLSIPLLRPGPFSSFNYLLPSLVEPVELHPSSFTAELRDIRDLARASLWGGSYAWPWHVTCLFDASCRIPDGLSTLPNFPMLSHFTISMPHSHFDLGLFSMLTDFLPSTSDYSLLLFSIFTR
jgi:hypothetical protein